MTDRVRIGIWVDQQVTAGRAGIEYVLRTFARNQSFAAQTEAGGAFDVRIDYGASDPALAEARLTVQVKAAGADLDAAPGDFAALLRAAAPGGLKEFITESAPGVIALSLDVLAAAYWCLTRMEERSGKRDAKGRFLCHYSTAPKQFYDIPVVNRWFENLGSLVRERLGLPASPPREQQTIALTHDIDLIRKYAGGSGLARSFARMLKNPGAGAKDLKAAAAVNFSGRRDPYDSFDDLFAIKERISAHSTFFMMTKTGAPNDCDYILDEPQIRNMLLRARTFGDEIGVHPGWNSGTSPELIQREVKAVTQANGEPVLGSRQHYLRFEQPQTWRHLAAAGVKYDSSLGWPDYAGFRLGWSGPLRPFDVETQQELPVLEIPLVCMDVTLSTYEEIPSELCLERMTNLLDASCDHLRGGAFVFLWHNSIADRDAFPGYWDTFEYFFSIASGSARFVKLSQLCEEYEQREAAVVQ